MKRSFFSSALLILVLHGIIACASPAFFDETQKFSSKKLSEAQKNLGNRFFMGLGVEPNQMLSFQWYKKAADSGSANAQYNVGYCYQKGIGVEVDQKMALYWYLKSADQGNVPAILELGVMYEVGGLGLPKNRAEALKYYERAALAENPFAQHYLGNLYSFDQPNGTRKNEVLAFKWYLKAAEQGQVLSQTIVGLLYYFGIGVTRDLYKAAVWLLKAADAGYDFAKFSFGYMIQNGWDHQRSQSEAFKVYESAFKYGDVDAEEELEFPFRKYGDMMYSLRWIKRAAEEFGFPPAQYCLAHRYDFGISVPVDKDAAIYWYQIAAHNGFTFALKDLDYMLEYGTET